LIFDVQAIVDLFGLLYCLDFVDLPLTIVAPFWLLLDALLVLVDMLKLLFMI
jgi:hypothetical protein